MAYGVSNGHVTDDVTYVIPKYQTRDSNMLKIQHQKTAGDAI